MFLLHSSSESLIFVIPITEDGFKLHTQNIETAQEEIKKQPRRNSLWLLKNKETDIVLESKKQKQRQYFKYSGSKSSSDDYNYSKHPSQMQQIKSN